MSSYLVTGSSRGLGLCLVTTLAARPAEQVRFIAATARSKTAAIQDLIDKYPDRVAFVPMETTSQESVQAAAREVEKLLGPDAGLDVVVNNAGVMPWTRGGTSEMTDLMQTCDVNVNGPHLVTAAFLPLLRKGSRKMVVNISSTLGSMGMAERYKNPVPAYKISKAALNMLTVQWALDHADEGFIFLAISPGWLQTDMGSQHADLPVQTGVDAALDIMDHATKEDNGKFLDIHVPGWAGKGKLNDYPGGVAPW